MLRYRLLRRAPGQFQTYSYTLPDRYPWLFAFARDQLDASRRLRILSFGCSTEEVFVLHRYFPEATIKGIDVDTRNIAACIERAPEDASTLQFANAASTHGERSEHYDAIFCLSVLCLSDLTALKVDRCDPFLTFDQFEQTVADFARCLKPGGLLFLYGCNFRFCDTSVARQFEVVLRADLEQLDHALTFGPDNRLLTGERYRAVGFRRQRADGDVPAQAYSAGQLGDSAKADQTRNEIR
jgi:SAM-dependent methyltransferase